MNSDSFKAISFETAKTLKVNRILLALGSNYQAETNLKFAKQELSKFGKLIASELFVNPDYSATDTIKPDYSNQCIILNFFESVDITSIIKKFKNIELQTGRKHYKKSESGLKHISLDIDVLAIQSEFVSTNKQTVNTGLWLVLEKRYPFKHHEKVCLKELVNIF